MEKIILSIIVPIYNIENYIEKCVESILSQKCKDYELILVNDGSTDNSLTIINKYKINNNIKILTKENGGLSSARNYGIKHAEGKYLMFIDGDDFLYDDECLTKIVNSIKEEDSEVIQYKMVQYFTPKNKYIFLPDLIESKSNNKLKVLKELNYSSQISVSACDKVIKRKIIMENNLFFEDGLLSEDVLWSLKIYMHIKRIRLLNENIYVYRQQRQGSITTSKSNKNANDLYLIIKYWMNYEYKSEETKKLYYNIISYWYLILRVKFTKKNYSKEMNDYFKANDKNMIGYCENYKVKMAYKISRVFGFDFSILIMRIYLYLKNKGLLKI